MNNHFYQVAGHSFRLSSSDIYFQEASLTNYAPFQISDNTGKDLFHLSVVRNLSDEDKYNLLGQFDDNIASITIFKSEKSNFRFQIAYPGSKDYCTMDVDSFFSQAKITLPDNPQHKFFCLNNCLMLLYAFATSHLDTLLIHASVIKNNNEGFVFLGKSGTGKSTHSRLWLKHIQGSELLNDDNPVIRIIEDEAYVFGTPWSGKTACYRNSSALLKGIVKLRQAPQNQTKQLSLLQAYAVVLPACSTMRWESNIASGVHHTVEKLIGLVNCYQLNCLPDKAAAQLSADTMHPNR